jgi:hypothetical protein
VFCEGKDIYESRCIQYKGLTRKQWITLYRKKISPMGWKYYGDHVYDERQKQHRIKYGEASDYFDDAAEESDDDSEVNCLPTPPYNNPQDSIDAAAQVTEYQPSPYSPYFQGKI